MSAAHAAALAELVELKDLKDFSESTSHPWLGAEQFEGEKKAALAEYTRRKPLAWATAQTLAKGYCTEGERCVCGGDTPAVRSGCHNWCKPAARDALVSPLQALQDAHEANAALADMTVRKDAAYLERNQVVAALAKAYPSGVARTAIEGWSEDWHGCVYIDLPTGQASWHFHDSQAYLFLGLPAYSKPWDGHDTPEKYRRLAALELRT